MKFMHTGNICWIDNGYGTKYPRINLPRRVVSKFQKEYQIVENNDDSFTIRFE